MPHIDTEFIQQLQKAIKGEEVSNPIIYQAIAIYSEWKSAKTLQYPDTPEFFLIQRFDGSWTSPSELKWKGRLIENQMYPLCEVGLICPDCGSANTCYSMGVEAQVCFNCDRLFDKETGKKLLADKIAEGNILYEHIDSDDCLVATVGIPKQKKPSIAKVRKEIDEDEGFVEYGKK